MNNILLIANSISITSAIKHEAVALGWSCQAYQVVSMVGAGSVLAAKKKCIIWVIDKEFIYHFGNVLCEMEAIVRNCSEKTSIYFLLEGVDKYVISSWQKYAKKLFTTSSIQLDSKDILSEIVLMEM